jgi:hypothetical protein
MSACTYASRGGEPRLAERIRAAVIVGTVGQFEEQEPFVASPKPIETAPLAYTPEMASLTCGVDMALLSFVELAPRA